MSVAADEELHRGFAGWPWLVHKFGGTSVANAECYRQVAQIVEQHALNGPSDVLASARNLAIVVSAMGGKPKVTDLLLTAVEYASERQIEALQETLRFIVTKHQDCLQDLFAQNPGEQERLLKMIHDDLNDIRDILKTVSLMKWKAERISELVSGYGEIWSAQILASLLTQRNAHRQASESPSDSAHESNANSLDLQVASTSYRKHHFVYLDARRVITVDEDAIQDGAVVWHTSQEKMEQAFAEEQAKIQVPLDNSSNVLHFVITGYVASNTHGVATTLQRDGSDYTAAIFGRLLNAHSICIWTDVDGVLSADPRRVPLAHVLPEVSYNEAMELAYFGAKVIHPKTMQPAISSTPQIPIYIRNTFNPTFPGTRIYITSTTTKDKEHVVCGFSSIEKMALINVEGSGLIGVPGVAMRIFGTLERIGVNVVLISQASSEHSVSFATVEAQAMQAKEAIEEEFRRELKLKRLSSVEINAPCSIIAAVGDGMMHTTGVAGRFFSALGDAKINVHAIAQGSSERNISAVVGSNESTRALRAVHAAFSLSHNTIRVGIIGMSEVGDSLLQLLEERRGVLRSTFDVDVQVCAVLPAAMSQQVVALKRDTDSSTDSITFGAYNKVCSDKDVTSGPRTVFEDDEEGATAVDGGIASILGLLFRSECTSHVIFDCTNDEKVGAYHAQWLRAGIDVVTANNTGISGSKERRSEIKNAEIAQGKQSARYLREVTVAGGLPVLSTLSSLLQSGDSIRRIDGVFTVAQSYIMYRISPPPSGALSSQFDKTFSNGVFEGDMSPSPSVSVAEACSFSQAVKEAIALGLTEENPVTDLNNEYAARVLMVLARELGMDANYETSTIQEASDMLIDFNGGLDLENLPPEIDQQVQERVDAAKSRGCVLRSISSIDFKDKTIGIKLVEVPQTHVFAISNPSCACVRFFTKRHRRYPLIIQGPSAGADSTASALLAELLRRTRGLSSPRSLALSREGSGASLRHSNTNSELYQGS